ncbi:MAG: hypothetical protein Q8L54_11250, partial [Devosia sp.]|nr:hypothetical protein [Devosia sp.]
MNNSPVQADGEIGLLDVVVTLAESWRLLLLGPLLAGAIAFGGAAFMPKAYESEAVLGLSASELVLLRSARVLDPVLEQQGLAGASGVDAAREQLIASLKTKRIGETGQAGETGFYRVEVSQPAAPDAQALLQQIIAQLIVQSAPRGAARRTLELRLASAREALDQLIAGQEKLGVIYETAASRAAADGSVMGLGEVGRSIVELAGGIESRRGEILRAELALA